MSTNIKIDTTLALVTDDAAAPDALRLFPTGVRVVNGDTRSYFVMLPPTRLLIVLRNGQTFADLAGMETVEALIGWDQGNPGFVREVGKQHTKITVLGPASELVDTTLSAVIANAPPNQPETRKITLPASLWARIDDLGQGDTKTGLAKIMDYPLEARAMSANKALRNIALNLGITITTSDSPDDLLLAILRSITCLEVERNYYRDLKPQE